MTGEQSIWKCLDQHNIICDTALSLSAGTEENHKMLHFGKVSGLRSESWNLWNCNWTSSKWRKTFRHNWPSIHSKSIKRIPHWKFTVSTNSQGIPRNSWKYLPRLSLPSYRYFQNDESQFEAFQINLWHVHFIPSIVSPSPKHQAPLKPIDCCSWLVIQSIPLLKTASSKLNLLYAVLSGTHVRKHTFAMGIKIMKT